MNARMSEVFCMLLRCNLGLHLKRLGKRQRHIGLVVAESSTRRAGGLAWENCRKALLVLLVLLVLMRVG